MKKEKNGFILYKSFYEPIKSFSNDQLGRLFRAIFEYQINAIEAVDSDIQIAFSFFKNQMDIEDDKYLQVSETRRLAGQKGGRPKTSEKAKKPNAFFESKKTKCNQKKHIGKDRIGEDRNIITTPTNVVVVESDSVREDIISDPVNTNAGARENAAGEDRQKTARSEKCMARKRPQPRKTLREDDAEGMDDPEISTLPAAVNTWRDDFEVYLTELRMAYKTLREDDAWISTQQRFYPNLNIPLSLEKACVNFWATEAGWIHKKRQKTVTIDWRRTLTNAISQPQNKVYNDNRPHNNGHTSNGVSEDFKRGIYETLLRGGCPENM